MVDTVIIRPAERILPPPSCSIWGHSLGDEAALTPILARAISHLASFLPRGWARKALSSSPTPVPATPPRPVKLLDRVREALRIKHYSLSAEETMGFGFGASSSFLASSIPNVWAASKLKPARVNPSDDVALDGDFVLQSGFLRVKECRLWRVNRKDTRWDASRSPTRVYPC